MDQNNQNPQWPTFATAVPTPAAATAAPTPTPTPAAAPLPPLQAQWLPPPPQAWQWPQQAAWAPAVQPMAVPQRRQPPAKSPSPLPIGFKIRVQRRAGLNDPIASPGRLVWIGEYYSQDLTGEHSIAAFLQKHIHRGGPALYVVERLDDKDVVVQSFEIPVDTPAGVVPTAVAASQPQQTWPQVQESNNVADRLINMLEQREADTRQRLDAALDQLQSKGTDATTMLVIQQLREELRRSQDQLQGALRSGGGGQPWQWPGPSYTPIYAPAPTPALPDPFGGLGGLGSPAAQPQQQPLAEALNKVVDKLTAVQPLSAPTQQQIGFAELLKFAEIMRPAAPVPLPSDPVKDKLMDIAMQQMAKPPEKSRGMAELLGDMQAVTEFMDRLNGSGGTLSTVLENADVIGEAIAKVVGAMSGRAAPTVPARTKPAQQPPPQPPDAAVVAMRGVTAKSDDPVVVTSVWNAVQALGSASPPWVEVAQRFVNAFRGADSKPELRALVTQFYARLRLRLDEDIIETVAAALHRNYNEMHQALFGTPKVPADVAATTATPTSTSVPAPTSEDVDAWVRRNGIEDATAPTAAEITAAEVAVAAAPLEDQMLAYKQQKNARLVEEAAAATSTEDVVDGIFDDEDDVGVGVGKATAQLT